MDELVSVVIPTYNNERTLYRCLDSIKNQNYRKIEIIVVDRYSKDKTAKIAKKYTNNVISDESERTKAKNIGLGKAKGRYICFVDADMELKPGVLQECISKMKNNIGGIIIPERSIGKSFWVKVRDFERSFYAGTVIESARFFRKDLAEKVNGFDENIIFYEEKTLPQRIEKLGFQVNERVESEILHHEEDFDLWKWLKKKYYYGKTAQKTKQTSITYRLGLFLKNKRFYMNPVLALGVITLKKLELFATVLGRIFRS